MTALVPFPGPSGHIHINSIGRDQHNHTSIVSGDQHNVTKNIYESRGRLINDILLETLNPPEMDCTMRTGCLGDTRADVLAQVIDWACKPASLQRTLWLHGPAGSGKSTRSTTLVERFRQLKQLGAFLFLSRDNTEGSNPALVTRNLAHQISLSYPEIGVFIVSAVKNNTHTLTSQISSQFQELIINPLSSVSTNSQIVLLLDAMDECGTKTDRKALLNTLAEQSAYLPPTSRLIITSRPDIDMRLAFEFQPHIKPLELDLTSTATQRDILTYIRHQMKSIYKKNRYLGLRWPGDKKVKALARRACGLFVWASIVCNFIDAHDPCKHLDIILKGNQAPTADAALDSLYQTALKVLGVWDDADFVEDFRSIVCIMLVLRNPLSTVAIDNLLTNSDRRPSAHTIEKLSCVICSSPTVRFIHPSVADFLMDKSRGGNEIWFFTPPLCERNMATLCLRRLSKVLHRDMSRFAPLVDREDDTIPKDVAYACVFWVDHVCMIEDDLAPIGQLLETFIDQHILHWFEAMSLLHRSSLMVTLLGQLLDWIQSHWHLSNRRSLQQHVRHWWRFSEEYEECIRECPMEVYSEELRRKFPLTQVQEPLISRPPAPSIFDLFPLTPSSSEAASQDFPSISHPASFPASDFLAPVSRSISPTPSGTSKIPFFSRFFNIVEKQASIYSQSRHSSTSGKRLYTSHSPTRLGRRLSRPSLNHPRHRSSSVGSRRLSRSSLGIDRHRSSSVSSMVQQKSSSDTSFIGPTLHSSSRRHSFSCRSGSPLDGIASAAPTQSRAAATRERDKDTEKLRKEQQLPLAPRTGTPHTRALNIQKALAPFSTDRESKSHHEHRSDKALLSEERKEKRGVKGKERKGGDPAELTRLVGYLTATEDWSLAHKLCDCASANEANAKEAVKALRREFKYGEQSAQLSATRLWAIMLRNSSEIVMQQMLSRKFLDTLEAVLTSSRTSTVVRDRLMDVLLLAAVVYTRQNRLDCGVSTDTRSHGFQELWQRLKPADKLDKSKLFKLKDEKEKKRTDSVQRIK